MDDTEQPETDTSEPEETPAQSAPEAITEESPAEEPLGDALVIAPGVPRLGIPVGAGKHIPAEGAPNYLFLTIVSVATLGIDIASKNWAEKALEAYPGTIAIWENHAAFILAKNKGGAWGFFQGASESIRRPFFLLVSAAAIVFIVTLFRRLQPKQYALRWGLPLVMGGALGNVFDRIRYGSVIDFIDVHMLYKGVDRHWPTFNVADIAICVGVGLMAVDMFTSKRGKSPTPPSSWGVLEHVPEAEAPPAESGPPEPAPASELAASSEEKELHEGG